MGSNTAHGISRHRHLPRHGGGDEGAALFAEEGDAGLDFGDGAVGGAGDAEALGGDGGLLGGRRDGDWNGGGALLIENADGGGVCHEANAFGLGAEREAEENGVCFAGGDDGVDLLVGGAIG